MTRRIRVLWVVNVVLPAVAEQLGCSPTPFGGWLSTMIGQLAQADGVQVGVAMRAPVSAFQVVEHAGVTYYAVPQTRSDPFDVREVDCLRTLEHFRPDLLHAEGSEMAYTRRFLMTWSGPKLLSMQGVINGYEPYELGRLPIASMLMSFRLRQALPAVALLANKRLRFMPRLKKERESLAMVQHVMGRTPWDRAQAYAHNPLARYHSCSRILRDHFYTRRWNEKAMERHSVFIGNAASPRKGAHFAVQAIAQLRREYPDVKLYVSGEKPGTSRFKSLFGYPAYLTDLIRRLQVEDAVEFLGVLPGETMADRICRSHVFLLPSVIENSPNTLGEAMVMGVPCVAAYVGGVPGMAADEKEALLYRADDPRMLAYQIKRLFDSPELCQALTAKAVERARRTHDAASNLQALVAAYQDATASGAGT